MFDSKNILARLQAGERIEDIAQSAADALNAAKAEYDRIETEKREAEAKAKEREKKLALQKQKKENGVRTIMNSIVDYINEFYPGFIDAADLAEFHKTFDPTSVIEAFDNAMEEIKKLPTVAAELNKNPDKMNVKLSGDEAKAAEKAINKFLYENNLF